MVRVKLPFRLFPMTIALIAVYSPMALMGGITGTLFKEFALTLLEQYLFPVS